MRYPAPLRPDSPIAVTAPSAGVDARCHARLDLVLAHLRNRGFRVLEGQCLRRNELHVSDSLERRAAELMQFLTRDDVAAVMPPWGGEFLIELLPRLDFERLSRARPRWVLGFSDVSTLLLALTLRTGTATAHGPNLMDLVPGQDDPLTAGVLDHLALPAGSEFEQRSSQRFQKQYRDFAVEPSRTFDLTEPTVWRTLDGARSAAFAGRLIGGCLDTVSRLAGSPFGDVSTFACEHAADGVVIYLENCELSPQECARALWSIRLAGWFEHATGVLIGRSTAPDGSEARPYGQTHALRSALGDLGIPVLWDIDLGHRAPQMLFVNGALAKVEFADGAGRVVQTLA